MSQDRRVGKKMLLVEEVKQLPLLTFYDSVQKSQSCKVSMVLALSYLLICSLLFCFYRTWLSVSSLVFLKPRLISEAMLQQSHPDLLIPTLLSSTPRQLYCNSLSDFTFHPDSWICILHNQIAYFRKHSSYLEVPSTILLIVKK